MPAIVDKPSVTKVCVDDFALRKRFSYGTVMVDLESHRIIDLISSRETTDVANWLATFPNIQVISRDGAATYSSAATGSHPEAIPVSYTHLTLRLSSAASDVYKRQIHALQQSGNTLPYQKMKSQKTRQSPGNGSTSWQCGRNSARSMKPGSWRRPDIQLNRLPP